MYATKVRKEENDDNKQNTSSNKQWDPIFFHYIFIFLLFIFFFLFDKRMGDGTAVWLCVWENNKHFEICLP